MGLVFANESTGDGMAEILEFMHKYIQKGNVNEQVVFGGNIWKQNINRGFSEASSEMHKHILSV